MRFANLQFKSGKHHQSHSEFRQDGRPCAFPHLVHFLTTHALIRK